MKTLSIIAFLVLITPLVPLRSANADSSTAAGTGSSPENPHLVSTTAAPDLLAGTVLETMNAAGYTYIRMATADGEAWAAVPETALSTGEQVRLRGPLPMSNFYSPTLDRSFEMIYFGALSSEELATEDLASIHSDMAHGEADVSSYGMVASIARAEGSMGHTIEELHSMGTEQVGKTVAVRGLVTRFSPGILGKNWLRLVDGTGSQEEADTEVAVATQDDAQVGDIVLVSGTLAFNVDIGMGHVYPVLIENAKITR